MSNNKQPRETTDRRREPRTEHEAVVIMAFGAGEDLEFEAAQLLDCSPRGVAILLGRPLPVGHHFFLKLRVNGRVCLVDYAVRNCFPTVDGGHRVGAEFCQVVGREVDPDLDGLLTALLDADPEAIDTAQ